MKQTAIVTGVKPTIVILKVHLLDDLAHAQNVGSSAEHVHAHPCVTGVEGGESSGSLEGVSAVNGGLDISPSGNDGAEHHQAEGQKSQRGNTAAEPEDLTISNDDNGQVLEDGVHGNGKELEGLGAGIDHAHEKQRNGEPCRANLVRTRTWNTGIISRRGRTFLGLY